MIKSEVKGSVNLGAIENDFVREVGAKSVATASRRFVEFLRYRRFDQLFNSDTGETRDSIDTYRYKSKKMPAYVVKAGVGIPGNLNYLAGLYRGHAVSRSGKVFSFARQRNLIDDGWKAWGGDRELVATSEQTLERMIAKVEKKLES